ncbi:ABC transporter ATP-binding protein [Euzebya rosea]|uniref:ABC transporter ATP-binding protein n=1 Tax=Euzebya rosea TaxID=2052804 RepID=UPI000D3E844E|nr:ABC transporter ATP-binding protein [Euzebya rosea]
MATEPAVRVRSLRKAYGGVAAVDDLSFDIAAGEVVALLGPNGAGKTTTVEILEGHRQRDTGEVSVLGHDPGRGERALRERIGIVLQEAGIEDVFSVREILTRYRSMYPRRRDVDEVLDVVGLREKADERVTSLSGGQRRRVDLALGLIGDPDLIFLDEPTTGFDPSARRQAWEVVEGLRSLGRTILLTTHYLDEAEHLADRVLVIARGRLLAEGTTADLEAASGLRPTLRFRLGAGGSTTPADPADVGIALERAASGWYSAPTDAPARDLHRLTGWALEAGVELEGLEVRRPTLEDVYLDLVGADGVETGPMSDVVS